MTLIQDASCFQGDHLILNATLYTSRLKTERKNLNNATVECRIGRRDKDRLTLRITGTPNANGSACAVTDPNNGIAQISIRQGDTAALEARRYSLQVIVTDAAGKPKVVTDGHLSVGETLPSA